MTAKRKILVPVCAMLAAAVLVRLGYWARGTAATASPEVLRGTVVAVGGDPAGSLPVDEFGVRLDGSPDAKSYGLGEVMWTDTDGTVKGGTAPSCMAVGRRISFGVVYFTHDDLTTSQVVWVDCRG